jgi:alkanesulfonate monooxygenase SsuD/methylene tetrahydromethanopterin reductase-like flavin-dependent oxidoreductase (luciferase family)
VDLRRQWTVLRAGAAWIGSPDDIAEQIVEYDRKVGGFEIASLQVNFNTLALEIVMGVN